MEILDWLDAHGTPEARIARDEIIALRHSAAFYKRRCDELQRWQSAMRGPDQTLTAPKELKAKVGAGKTATVTREMICAAHDVTLVKGDFVLSAALLERLYLAMEQAAPPPQTPFDTCPTCEALARTVMMDQTGAARTTSHAGPVE